MNPKTHKFCGVKYKIAYRKIKKSDYLNKQMKAPKKFPPIEELTGLCQPPDVKHPKIVLDLVGLDAEEELATVLDEAIHACHFTIPDKRVDRMSDSIAAFLLKLGYRRIDTTKHAERRKEKTT